MCDFTTFSDIYHIFLNSIKDYQIKALFNEDISVAEDLLETFLMRAIPKFRNCQKDIRDVDMVNKSFRECLTIEEKEILAELMLLSWMDYVVNDITQMNLSLSDTDYKHFSEERNLREKSMYTDRLREKTSQEMVEYGLHITPFSEWAVGNYGI